MSLKLKIKIFNKITIETLSKVPWQQKKQKLHPQWFFWLPVMYLD